MTNQYNDRPIHYDAMKRAIEIIRLAMIRQTPSQINDGEAFVNVDFTAHTGTLYVLVMTRDGEDFDIVQKRECRLYESDIYSADEIMNGLDEAYHLVFDTLSGASKEVSA